MIFMKKINRKFEIEYYSIYLENDIFIFCDEIRVKDLFLECISKENEIQSGLIAIRKVKKLDVIFSKNDELIEQPIQFF